MMLANRAALAGLILGAVLSVLAWPVTASNTLYGVVYDTTASQEKLVSINPASGGLTDIGSGISDCCWVSSGVSTLDPVNDVLYFIGHYMADASGTDRVFSIDLASGAVTADPTLPADHNYNFIEADLGSGTLYAMVYDLSALLEKLVVIDPSSGTMTAVGSGISNCCMVPSGVSSFDSDSGRFYFIGHYMSDSGIYRIFGIDAATGAVVNDAVLPANHNYNFLEYDFGSGTLYAMVYDTTASLEKLVTVDPVGGTLTTVGSGISSCCMVPSGVSSFDPNNDRFYFVGHYMSDSGVYRVFGIDTATGTVASDPTLPTGINYNFLELDPTLNQPPIALCQNVTVSAGASCLADASIDAGSYDPDGDPMTVDQDPAGPYGIGDTVVELTAEDAWGLSDTCQATVTVVDDTAPMVQCNAPATIIPPDAPISFTATADDDCGADSLTITSYDCYKYTSNGKRIDKRDSCVVQIDGETVTIINSGGVGDNIEWQVIASDGGGNSSSTTCHILVTRPGRS